MLFKRSVLRAVAVLAAVTALAAGCSSDEEEPRTEPSPTPTAATELTFAVYGPEPVLRAYREIAARYNLDHPETKVEVRTYATHAKAAAALRTSTAKGEAPDLFLMEHEDLTSLAEDNAVRRVDDLLAEREIDFGDVYTRSGLEAFSADSALQCMPQEVSPLVVYYNPGLIKLDQVAEPGSNPVTQEDGWSLEEFGRAALQARAPGVRGLYIEPDLEQVAPFIWSGGGDVVDDVDEPTRLTLSEDASAAALEQLLELVRARALTFDQKALARQPAIERFKEGKLGMILGYRDLTPELRADQDLTFDVMPLPKLSSGATVASMSGLCISSESENTAAAADFLAAVISDEGAATLAETGYVMPANLDVVNDYHFLQAGQRPLHSEVFADEVRDTRPLPSTPRWPLVRRATTKPLTELFYLPVIAPLQERLEAIDEGSVPLFDPSQAGSPSSSPSATPSS